MCAALVLMLMTGCRIPNLKPFSDATTEMATVLKVGFERSRALLSAAAQTADDQAAFKTELKDLEAKWKPTREALSALVEYSDSLAAVAEAGKKGPETMAQLTGAITDLAKAVSITAIPAVGVEVVNRVGAKIIEIQAARDIRKAVGAAGDAIEIIAPILKATFVDLRNIHGAAGRAYASRVQAESSILANYYESLQGDQERLEYLPEPDHRLSVRAGQAALACGVGEDEERAQSRPGEQAGSLNPRRAARSAPDPEAVGHRVRILGPHR